jgi:hypothetical protein
MCISSSDEGTAWGQKTKNKRVFSFRQRNATVILPCIDRAKVAMMANKDVDVRPLSSALSSDFLISTQDSSKCGPQSDANVLSLVSSSQQTCIKLLLSGFVSVGKTLLGAPRVQDAVQH